MKKIFFLFFTILGLQGFSQEVSKTYDRIGKFHNGVAIVWKDGLCGLIKQSGKELVKPEYEKIGTFGRDALAETVKLGKTGLINMEGKIIAPNVYESIGPFHGFYAITKKDGLVGMINKKGKVVVDNDYESIKIGRHGEIRAVKNGQVVMLDIKD